MQQNLDSDFPALGFIENNRLMSVLDNYLRGTRGDDDTDDSLKTNNNNKIETHYESTVSSIYSAPITDNSHNLGSVLVTCQGQQHFADLIVAADGTSSAVRRLLHNVSNPTQHVTQITQGDEHISESLLEHRGYKVK